MMFVSSSEWKLTLVTSSPLPLPVLIECRLGEQYFRHDFAVLQFLFAAVNLQLSLFVSSYISNTSAVVHEDMFLQVLSL